jgi:hypothetical protein
MLCGSKKRCSKSCCNQRVCFLGLKFEASKLVQGESSTQYGTFFCSCSEVKLANFVNQTDVIAMSIFEFVHVMLCQMTISFLDHGMCTSQASRN